MLAVFLQNELIALSNEAKRKNIEIKDSAERLLFKIRSIKEQKLSLSLELRKNDEVLEPFTLSFESKNQKLIAFAVSCIQKLITHNAICPTSLDSIVNSLSDSSISTQELQLKILQTILPLVTNYNVHGELLSSSLLMCIKLQDSKHSVVSNTAQATFRQLVIHSFEKLLASSQIEKDVVTIRDQAQFDMEVESELDTIAPIPLDSFNYYEKDAYVLFEDLYRLTSGEAGVLLQVKSLHRVVGLELLESVLKSTHQLFTMYPELLNLVKDKVCPLIIKAFTEKADFSITVRLMRVVRVLVKYFHKILPSECEVFLSLFSKTLENSSLPSWQRILVLECYKSLTVDKEMSINIFNHFDKNQKSANVYSEIVNGVCLVVFGAHDYLLSTSESELDAFALSSAAAIKIPCIDHLEKSEAPNFPDTYPIYIACQIILQIIDTQFEFILPLLSVEDSRSEKEIFLAIEMVKSSSVGLFYALTLLVISSIAEDFFDNVLDAIEKYSLIVGLLGLCSYRDAAILFLCKLSISSTSSTTIDYSCIPSDIETISQSELNSRSMMYSISLRNIQLLNCLIKISSALVDVLDSKLWYIIIETLSFAEYLTSSSKVSRRLESSASLTDMPVSAKLEPIRARANTIFSPSNPSFLELYTARATPILNEYLVTYFTNPLKALIELTKMMRNRSFTEFIKALCKLSQERINVCSHPSHVIPGKEVKLYDEKCFAVAKLYDISILNLDRLLNTDFQMFDLIANQLVSIVHAPKCSAVIRNQVCLSFGEIISAAAQHQSFKNELIETHIFETLSDLMAFDNHDHNTTDSRADLESNPIRLILPEIRRLGMSIVYKVLQKSGQSIQASWPLILEIIFQGIHSQSANVTKRAKLTDMSKAFNESVSSFPTQHVMSPSAIVDSPSLSEPSYLNSTKESTLIKVGFPCIQLIATDFLLVLKPLPLSKCIETLTLFASLSDDLNISLSSIGLLWTVCDFILSQRQTLELQKDIVEPRDSAVAIKSPKEAVIDLDYLMEPLSMKTMDTLWMYLLWNLSELCVDERPEVRNSANQTLFRTIDMNGSRLSLESWNLCISHVLFPLLDRIKACAKLSSDKSWDETKCLSMNGVTKTIIEFMPLFTQMGQKFDHHWSIFLNYLKNNILESSQEVALSCLKNFKQVANYSKHKTSLESIDSKLWLNAFEIWVSIGQEIVNAATIPEGLPIIFEPIVKWGNGLIPYILQGLFTQEALAIFSGIILDLYEAIQREFTSVEFELTTKLMKGIILYHSVTIAGVSQSKLRADAVLDVDQMTTSQSHLIDFISGKLDLRQILCIETKVVEILSELTLCPFIPFEYPSDDIPVYVIPGIRKHSFIALSMKAHCLISSYSAGLRNDENFYDSGAFQKIIESFILPIRHKYECPTTGVKNPRELWKVAAVSGQNIIQDSIGYLTTSANQSVFRACSRVILDFVEEFILSNRLYRFISRKVKNASADQNILDEQFDLGVLNLISNDLFAFFGQSYIVGNIQSLGRLVDITLRVFSNDLNPVPVQLNFKCGKDSAFNASSPKIGSPTIGSPTILPQTPINLPDMTDLNISEPLYFERENVRLKSLQIIFSKCSCYHTSSAVDFKIQENCLPMLLEKCQLILKQYVVDKIIAGQLTMPYSRNMEATSIIKGLLELEPNHKPILFNDESDTHALITRKYLLSSPAGHLVQLYPVLCDFLEVLSGSIFLNNMGSGISQSEEAAMADMVRCCFVRVGNTFLKK